MSGFFYLIHSKSSYLAILDYHHNLWEYKLRMNRAERLLKSELARKKRHMKRAIVEKRTQEGVPSSKKAQKPKKKTPLASS